jgi:hypothetical protein
MPKIPSSERSNSTTKTLSYERADEKFSDAGALIVFAAWNDRATYPYS